MARLGLLGIRERLGRLARLALVVALALPARQARRVMLGRRASLVP